MKAKLEKIENGVAEFIIETDAKVFDKGMETAWNKNKNYFQVPGFRKGKAPKAMIIKMYGEEIFYDDAINAVLPEEYDKAVKKLELEPVDSPKIDVVECGSGKKLVVKAEVTLKPEVKLGKYKGIEIDKPEYNVTEADVKAELTKMQEKGARTVTVETNRAVKKDDIVTIDFEGFKDGVAFEGGKGENFDLTIGSGQFIPGFEDQLIGKKVDEEVTVNVTFPEEYHSEELKGAPAEFKVLIKAIKVKELPKLDDEFAKDVSEFDTLKDLKKDIKAKLKATADEKAKAEIENKTLEGAVANAEVEIPECMVDAEIENMMRNYDMRLQQQGMSLEQYMKLLGQTTESFKAQFKDQAKEQVKTSLVIEAIGKAENIEVTKEEVEAEFKKMSEEYKMDVKQLKSFIKADDLKADLTNKKSIELIASKKKFKKAEESAEEVKDEE